MVQISTDTEALKPILENSGDSQLSEEDRLDQQTALALEEIDKVATTNVSNAAGGLEGAFARGGTEIDPSKIKSREGAREKQIERLVQDTTTRIDRVLKRSADSYTGTLPTAGTGNLERILWANRADQVKNKITAVSSTAKDSVLLAEGYDVFYNEARARVEQELEDQTTRFNDFQEKYGESSWFGRRLSAKKRQAARFEQFQAPMQEALQKRLDEIQGRIDAMKEGPQADRVKRMSDNIDRRFQHASADKKVKLWEQIQDALKYTGTITGLNLSEFNLANEDEKLLFVESLINGDLPWVKERLALKEDSDSKFKNQAEIINSARTQEALVSGDLALDDYKTIQAYPELKGKEPHKEAVSSHDLAQALESDFRNNNTTKAQVDSWLGISDNKYDLLTDATKLFIFLKAIKDDQSLLGSLTLETQQKYLKWFEQAEEARGGSVETFKAADREKALNALDHLQGNVTGASTGISRDSSILGQITAQLKGLEHFNFKTGNISTLQGTINLLAQKAEDTYKNEFLDTCEGEIPQADFDLIKAQWQKALASVRKFKSISQAWAHDQTQWEKWEDQTNTNKNGSYAKKIQTRISALSGNGKDSINTERNRINSRDYSTVPGGAVEKKLAFDTDQANLKALIEELDKKQEQLANTQNQPEPSISGLDEIDQILQNVSNQLLDKQESKLSPEKDPTHSDLNTQVRNILRTEFADQMEQTFLQKLAENDQYETLQKLGRGGRVQVDCKKVGTSSQMRFPDQLDNLDRITFKINRSVNGKIELVEDIPPAYGNRRVMVVTGPCFKGSGNNLEIVARAGLSEQAILTTTPTVSYGPSVNPEAAIITNLNVL